MTKLVIFDFADTIATLHPTKEKLLQELLFNATGQLFEDKKISDAYHYVSNALFYSSVQVSNQQDKSLFYNQFNQLLITILNVAHLISANEIFTYFQSHKQHWKLKSGANELFLSLKEQNFIISLVSNFDSRLHTILDDIGVREQFDSIFISQDVGLEKPDIRFLQMPMIKHNMKPDDTYFIGDSFYLDFSPAIQIGMNAVLLDESDRYPSIYDKYKIKKLTDLYETLKENI